MTLTVDFTGEINAAGTNPLIFGEGTNYDLSVTGGAIVGLGLPGTRTRDQNRGDYPGVVGGVDLATKRTLRFSIEVVGDTVGAAYAAFRDLKAAWQPQASNTTLDLRLPWFESTSNTLRFYGRPRDLDADIASGPFGIIPVLATFDALDPYGYGAEETVTDSSSPAAVTNSGDVPSDRFTIAITGSGGTPSLTSTTDDNSTISFNQTLGVATVATLDFRTHTITISGGDVYDRLTAGPEWFRLMPGANSIPFTGCASLEIVHRPAYL